MCLQGASAVQRVLEQEGNGRVTVFAVWEPVLSTDWGAPSGAALRRLGDQRVRQYWDPDRLLSKAMGETDRASVVWDRVLLYPARQAWEQSAPPRAFFEDGPVIRVVAKFTGALKQAEQFSAPE